MALCTPWLTPADLVLCDIDQDGSGDPPTAEEEAAAARAVLVASLMLYRASGRQYPGLCTDVVRPCAGCGLPSQSLDYPFGGSRPIGLYGPCSCGPHRDVQCGCSVHAAVQLPGRPITSIVSVLMNGTDITDDVTVIDGDSLIRISGTPWPCIQDLTKAATEPGTWQVTYTYGRIPDADGLLAAEVLACQLLAGWCTSPGCPECKLPQRLTSMTREGDTIQMAALDPFEFLEGGRFGVYEVDSWLSLENPGRIAAPARVRSARDYLSRGHHRRA